MKTSKYIQTALLLFIFGTTLILFLDAKSYTEDPANKLSAFYHTKLLDDFSVIVAEKNSKFWLRNDSVNRVFSQYMHNGPLKEGFDFKCFILKNDTLFISNVDEKYTLFVNGQFVNKIIGKENSEIGLLSYNKDTLSFILTKAKVTGCLKNDSIKLLKIEAKNHSEINLGRAFIKIIDSATKEPKFKTLDLTLKEAEITLKDHSKLSMQKPQKLIINSDKTSDYTIYNSNSNEKVPITSSTMPIAN